MQSLRGTRDIFGSEASRFCRIVEVAQIVSKRHNFEPLITPSLEFSSLFERNIGNDTDIVSKEIYKFTDKGDNEIALRPEFTAGVVRAFVNNSELRSKKAPVKLFSHGSLFRYERPQAGRYREFFQLNFEIFGKNDINHDLDIILTPHSILRELGIVETKLMLNFIGGAESKMRYIEYLQGFFQKYVDDLSDDSKKRLHMNKPLRILDSKSEIDKKILENIRPISDFYLDENRARNEKILNILEKLGVSYELNSNLVRGLDYYTDLVFEFIDISRESKSQNAICGGGRYDNMVSDISDKKFDISAVGCAIGIDRLMLLMQDFQEDGQKIAIIPDCDDLLDLSYKIRECLVNNSKFSTFSVDVITHSDSVSKNIKRASEMHFTHICIVDNNVLHSMEFVIKKMNSQEQDVYKL